MLLYRCFLPSRGGGKVCIERVSLRSGEECCEQRLVPAVTIHLVISAGAVSGCGFALAAIGRACKCRPIRAAKRRNNF